MDKFIAGNDSAALISLLNAASAAVGGCTVAGPAGSSGEGDGTPSTPSAAAAGDATPQYSAAFPTLSVTSANAAGLVSHVASAVAAYVAEQNAAAKQAAAASASTKPSTAAAVPTTKVEHLWSVLELSLLSKAVAKFPAGTRNRWQTIADYVNTVGHNSILRSADECIHKAKTVGEEDRRAASTQAFATYSAILHNKGKSTEIHDKDAPAPEPHAAFSTSAATATAAAAPAPAAAAPASAAAPTSKKKSPSASASSASAASSAHVPSVPAPAPAPAVDPEMGVWSPEDQKLLEAALRTYPATLDKVERWTKIAAAVPGKTKKQCAARFKFLREQVLAAKGTGGGSS